MLVDILTQTLVRTNRTLVILETDSGQPANQGLVKGLVSTKTRRLTRLGYIQGRDETGAASCDGPVRCGSALW